MQPLIGGKRPETVWLYALAGMLMIGGPIWHELYVMHYPLRPESFFLPLAAGAIGALIAVGGRAVGGLFATVVFGGLLFAFTDLQLQPETVTYMAVVLAVCVVLSYILASHRATISAIALGAFYAASLFRTPIAPKPATIATAVNTAPARPTSPLLVHIILDEQWGVGGLRAAGDTTTAKFLADFYLERGFAVYEAAYSRYEFTDESVANALSLGSAPSFSRLNSKIFFKSLHNIPYFVRLRELGYAVHVYQSTYLDFCSAADAAVSSCDSEPGNSIRTIGYLKGNWLRRGELTARYFLNTRSHIYKKLLPDNGIWRRQMSGGGLAAAHRLSREIAARPAAGSAFFVHLLLPHRPISVDAECRVLTDLSGIITYHYPTNPSDSLQQARLRFLAGQIRCAQQAVASVIAAVDSTVGKDNSIIIVHGDHGSRMHLRKPMKDSLAGYTVDELNTVFSTLLAIRRPRIAGVLISEPTPLQDVIWELARSGFSGPLPGNWQHFLRKMPDSTGAHGATRPLNPSEMAWARRNNPA